MKLTKIGKEALTKGKDEKLRIASDLIVKGVDIAEFVVGGLCYDALAFCRFLLGKDSLTANDITNKVAQAFLPNFDFLHTGHEWDGVDNFVHGVALGFYRLRDTTFFHGAIGVEYHKIRAINGGSLGAIWTQTVDLSTVVTINPDGTFNYDGTKIKIYIKP